eukprot:389155_1
MADKFGVWKEIINQMQAIKQDMIVSNKQIINAFQNALQKQIDRMSLASNKLAQIADLIDGYPLLFDTINIRLSIIRNEQLIMVRGGQNPNPQKLKRNVDCVLKIMLHKMNRIQDQTMRSELVSFLTKIIRNKYIKETALAVIGAHFLESNHPQLHQIFQTAIKKVITHQQHIPQRLNVFMEVEEFYQFPFVKVHDYFMQIAMADSENTNIHLWDAHQIRTIQQLITKHAKPPNENAITLWNQILQKLIVLPARIEPIPMDDIVHAQSSDVESDTDNEEDMKHSDDDYDIIDDMKATTEHEEDTDDVELMHRLKYCFSMEGWLQFAMTHRFNLKPFDVLIDFVMQQLRDLNQRIESKNITIACVQLMEGNDITPIVQYCAYDTRFDAQGLRAMIEQLSDWKVLSQQFRIFLNKFTKPGDAIELETKTFLQILKDWDSETYIDMETREEWMNWCYPNANTLGFLSDMQQSHVFLHIWWRNRETFGDEQAMDMNHYMGALYKNSKEEWNRLVRRATDLQLTFEDKQYFQDVELIEELNMMKLPRRTVQKIEKDMADSLKLDRYVDFVQYLVNIVHVFIDSGHTKIEKTDDEDWERLNENLNTAKFRKNDKKQNISAAAKLYRDMKGAVNQEYSDLAKTWIKTVVKCEETVNKLRNEEQYQINRFSDTLRLIDDFATDGQMVQLSGSLRSIYQQFTNIWQQTFHTKIDLMQHFASIRIKRNDISNLLDVHENESKIKQIVTDAEKMAQQRAMETLDLAMKTGYFEFAEQKEIKQSIQNLNEDESEMDIIAANCLTLCFVSAHKQQRMKCNEIQSRIDIILLCRRSRIDDNMMEIDDDSEDEKEREEKKECLEEENVNQYIRKFEVCKDISELRVQYVRNGGRMSKMNEEIHERLGANASFDDFIGKQNEWRQRLLHWNDYVFQFRIDSQLLCYFTVNKIRVIIQQLNQYKKAQKYKGKAMAMEEKKEEENEMQPQWACPVCTLLNNPRSIRCGACSEPNPHGIRTAIQKVKHEAEIHLFEQLLSHFRFINPNLSEHKFKKRLQKWHIVDSNSDNALKYFDQFFDNDDILNLEVMNHVNGNVISYGVPNLMVTKSEKHALFATLKLYQDRQRTCIPSNQILICDKTTTAEHIQIFIFRCLQNERRFQYEDTSCAPLFCLLFPEYLVFSVMDAAVEIINKYLLSRNQKTKRYSFVVMSCTDKGNAICDILSPYRMNDVSSTFTDEDAKHICNALFNGHQDKDLWHNNGNKLFVRIYNSTEVGAGKSHVIQQEAVRVNENNLNSLIRIPINSSDIDLHFIIDRLYRCYDANKKHQNKKIIYHLDISSSASDSVNILLFHLIFLRYIATNKHECFAISPNMAFFIELPTKLASLRNKNHRTQDEFYLLHKPIQIARRHIDTDSNPFQFDDHCHFAVKFLQHFYSDELKTNDPDPTDQKVDEHEMQQMIANKFSNTVQRSPIHQKSVMEYLFTQFEQVVHSTPLRNEWRADQGQGFNQWKHLVTGSIIDLSEDFCQKIYNDDDDKYQDMDDESTGTEHFHLTQKWQNQAKPIVLLNQSVDGSISFLVSDKSKMDQTLLETATLLRFHILDWKQQDQIQSKEEKIALLLTILGTYSEELLIQLSTVKPYSDYALTFDNMLKMIAIFFRIKANIPVILMGETGCGKTALLSYLAKAANREIQRADVHGGFTYKHIKHKMDEWISIAKKKTEESEEMIQVHLIDQCGEMEENEYKEYRMYQVRKEHQMKKMDDLYIFFDEINTSPDVGCFKEILCDRHFDGEPLPTNMKIIAACNPRRRRKVKRKSMISDPLSVYMYRVYPCPSSMKEYIWMFGSLSQNDERAYAHQMCQTFTDQILHQNNQLQSKLSKFVVISQAFVRKKLKDSAFVSLRDIARCLRIFVYAFERSNDFQESMIEALALVYYFRLKDKDRASYNKQLSNHGVRGFYSTLQGDGGIIDKICDLFKDVIPRGIALNRSLRENLFLLFICIQTKTPLILVGNPGSSKTLAMSIIKSYMADKAGNDAQRLKDHHLKPIHVISFQCSTQSKADGIRERWNQAQKFAEENKDIICVLLLDEIGLAEHSTHRPLKVLHQLLEIDPAPIAFIGLSNWSLDAAKMNRAIMHLCPKHTIRDLTQTATAMAQQYVKRINKIKTKLKVLSYVYEDITKKNNKLQPRLDFFGARDFYAVVKHFLVATSRNAGGLHRNDDEELIMYFLRNFGGINYQNDDHHRNETRRVLFTIIHRHMALKEKHLLDDTVNAYPPVRLVELNLNDRRSTHHFDDAMVVDNFMISRHMMVITEHVNSWNVLLDLNIINYQNIFIFGSEFERDKTNNIYLHLNRVKQCMETGQTLILCHLDEINESLYDMLNQRYTFIKNSGKMYCRIALGSNSQTCFVDPEFKCIVISTKAAAHRDDGGVPIAFLNRFEKQLISYHSSLSPMYLRFLYKLRAEICDLYVLKGFNFKQIFPGFCSDTLPSLIMNVMTDDQEEFEDEKMANNQRDKPDLSNVRKDAMEICCNMLLGATMTESLIQTTVNQQNNNHRKSLVESIPSLQSLIADHTAFHKLLIVLTFDFENKLNQNIASFKDTHLVKMSQFSRSEQFEKFFVKFLTNNDSQKANLLLQYRHNDMNHFIHIKHMIEARMNHTNMNKTRVILLVHLHRNDDLYEEFPLIFCNTSRIVFLDSLSQRDPIPLDSFTNHSILDVCRERGMPLLQATFQRALSHLAFDTKMNIKHEIQTLSHLLSNDTAHGAIQKLIWDRFLRLLSHNRINRNIGDIVCKSISNHKSWQRGSFYERLHDIVQTVSVVAMIRVLHTLYSNSNLNILEHEDTTEDMMHLFVELYGQFDLIEDTILDIYVENILEVRPNQFFVKTDFVARFPFSDVIHSWCNSVKSRLNTDEEQSEDEKDDMKYGMSDDDGDYGMADMDIEIDPSARLKQEMVSVWPASLCKISMDIALSYVHDLIRLNDRKLQINALDSPEFIGLSAKLFMMAGFHFEYILYEDEISIAALETLLWHKSDVLRHVFAILKVLKPYQLMHTDNAIHIQSDTFIDTMHSLLDTILQALDHEMYQKFNLHSTLEHIQCMILEMPTTHISDLYSKWNMLKIKLITFKCDLFPIDDDSLPSLRQIMNGKSSLMNYNVLRDSFQLLTELIQDDSSTEHSCNQILYELLSLIQLDDSDNEEHQMEEYAQFLINVLSKLDFVIDIVDEADTIHWSQETKDEIVHRLFAVLSRDDMQNNDIMDQIQHENEELAGMIVQVRSRGVVDGGHVHYATSNKDFDARLNIKIPLIKQFNEEMYQQCMQSVQIETFFRLHQFVKMECPILFKVKRQDARFWNLYKLPQISEWIQRIQSKYMGTISVNACNKLTMNDVWKHCKLHKWGDINEWKQGFQTYKDAMNSISANGNRLPDTDHNISISSSLIGKNVNPMTKNNLKHIQNMIDIQNTFLTHDSHLTEHCNFFDLRPEQLIDTTKILDIIKANCKPWICYDAKNELPSQTYLTFNVERIENEMKEQCVNGRNQLNITFRHFECVGSKNMLRLIQSIGIAHEVLNYELWHLFDQQFQSNMQRKKALNTIENVLMLISNVKLDEDDDFDAFEDEKDDEKYQNNDQNHHDVAVNSPNQEFWRFMQNTLQYDAAKCQIFKISYRDQTIQLKHIQNLWSELIKRIDGAMLQYEDQCLWCRMPITEALPIQLECCGVSIHYDCLKQYIQNGFGNNGDRITLQQLSCLLCRHPMKHKAANDLFRETQILYDKVSAVAVEQLRQDNKMNDPQVRNDPAVYAMTLYAFFLCFQCKEPYFFGTNRCGDEESENNVNKNDRLCPRCDNSQSEEWIMGNTKQCPRCKRHIQKNGGCNHMTCRPPGGCGYEFYWTTLARYP